MTEQTPKRSHLRPKLLLQWELALIQIDIAARGRQIGVLFGLLEQFVEFLFEHLAVRFFGFELLAEDLIAPAGLALQFSHGCRQVFDCRRLLADRVRDHSAGFWIDLQQGLAAGTFDLDQGVRHILIILVN